MERVTEGRGYSDPGWRVNHDLLTQLPDLPANRLTTRSAPPSSLRPVDQPLLGKKQQPLGSHFSIVLLAKAGP